MYVSFHGKSRVKKLDPENCILLETSLDCHTIPSTVLLILVQIQPHTFFFSLLITTVAIRNTPVVTS